MQGYGPTSYGEGFADVYDDWYEAVSDVATTVEFVSSLSRGGSVLELGVGTGRVAIPLSRAGMRVTGVDASPSMLARLRGADTDEQVEVIEGDMVRDLPDGPFDVVLVAYNTLFNLTADGEQAACFAAVAARLRDGGRFVVETFVPDEPFRHGEQVALRSMTADQVVLSVASYDADRQAAAGQFVELTETAGVRLRPWSIRYSTVAQLDEMARDAGLDLEGRWTDVHRTPFDLDSDRHVSVYRRPTVGGSR